MSRGNTTIVGPEGDILAGPLEGEAGTIYAELDLGAARVVPTAVRPRPATTPGPTCSG